MNHVKEPLVKWPNLSCRYDYISTISLVLNKYLGTYSKLVRRDTLITITVLRSRKILLEILL